VATLLSMTRADLIERPLPRFIEQEDADSFYLLRKKLIAIGEPQSIELRLVTHDGATLWVHLETNIAQDKHESVIRIVRSDVTARK
jgi:PAS domain S-box-containing protein